MFITALLYNCSPTEQTVAGCGWKTKRQGTSGVALKKRRGRPD